MDFRRHIREVKNGKRMEVQDRIKALDDLEDVRSPSDIEMQEWKEIREVVTEKGKAEMD